MPQSEKSAIRISDPLPCRGHAHKHTHTLDSMLVFRFMCRPVVRVCVHIRMYNARYTHRQAPKRVHI